MKSKIQEALLAITDGKVADAEKILESLVLDSVETKPYDHSSEFISTAIGITDEEYQKLQETAVTIATEFNTSTDSTISGLVESIEKTKFSERGKIMLAVKLGEGRGVGLGQKAFERLLPLLETFTSIKHERDKKTS